MCTTTAAKELSNRIASTGKIIDADNHRIGLFTLEQTYVIGHCGVPSSFQNTPWQAAVGAGYDTGAIASVGTAAMSVNADFRRPSPSFMDAAQVDELTERMGRPSVVQVGDGKFCTAPWSVRGLPRFLQPGIHLALAPLRAAFEACRNVFNMHADLALSIQCLPFGPLRTQTRRTAEGRLAGSCRRRGDGRPEGRGGRTARCPRRASSRPRRAARASAAHSHRPRTTSSRAATKLLNRVQSRRSWRSCRAVTALARGEPAFPTWRPPSSLACSCAPRSTLHCEGGGEPGAGVSKEASCWRRIAACF